MTANAADFAGSGCGRRYEKELETHFRDCLLFYLDGRIRFERYWPTALTQMGKFCGITSRSLKASKKRSPAC